jgi:hypothetical protein
MVTIPAKNKRLLFADFFYINSNALETYGLSQDCKLFPNAYWHFDIVKRLMIKVNNSFVPNTLKMLMTSHISIKPLGIA